VRDTAVKTPGFCSEKVGVAIEAGVGRDRLRQAPNSASIWRSRGRKAAVSFSWEPRVQAAITWCSSSTATWALLAVWMGLMLLVSTGL
jgi:hypothetical protein